MLGELHIKDFAVIRDITISFVSGLNIISGEEGSGKSLIVDALSLLMGARAPAGLIRNGARSARVEAIFWPDEKAADLVNALLIENSLEPDESGMLVISRDFMDGGRSVARVNNRTMPLSFLRQIGSHLVDIHGQMEYLSLLDPVHQLSLVDAYGGLNEKRRHLRSVIERMRQVERELATIEQGGKSGYEELLKYQIDEIERAKLEEVSEEELHTERDLLRRAGAICEGCLNAYSNLYGDERSASVLIHKTLSILRSICAVDESLTKYREKLEDDLLSIEEIASELRAYSGRMESRQARLEEIEQKLEAVAALKRKYGNTIESIMAFHEKAKRELEDLYGRRERMEALEAERTVLRSEAAKLAEELSLERRQAADQLAGMVNEELVELGLEWARFDVVLTRKEDPAGLCIASNKCFAYTYDGIDRLEFQVSTNPGEPMRPMAAIASGGETSRLVLAIKSALKIADPIPTLIFDEIDMGVGGRNAESVGRKMAVLSTFHQVICITHLPQIACYGDAHFKMIKEIDNGRAVSRIEQIDGQGRLKELAAMLGSDRNGSAMLKGAEVLVKSAEKWKNGARELIAAQ
jgi:DNA repair protein RecN (Recombination protein N)